MSETQDDPYDPCHKWIAKCHELEHEIERLRGILSYFRDVDRMQAEQAYDRGE